MSGSRAIRVLFAIAPIAMAQTAGTGRISGTVIDASSGDAVRKAIVTLSLQVTPREWATARTDGSGQFKFENLPAGNYDLRASKQGFGNAIYGANSMRETGKTITLADGEIREGLTLRFIHSASISGRVVDSDGDPAPNMLVQLRRFGRSLGRRVLVNGPSTNTDDRGEYHLSGIGPGRYVLSAGSPGSPSRGSFSDRAPQVLMPQFYGGAVDEKDAAVLAIKDGDALTGMDFSLVSQAAVRIRGRVMGLPALPAAQDAEPDQGLATMHKFQNPAFVGITIGPVANRFSWGQGGAANAPDYAFDFGWLPPSEYRIHARIGVNRKLYAAAQLVDGRGGSADVVLTLAPAVDIKGRVRFEGERKDKDNPRLVLSASGMDSGGNPDNRLNAEIGADGRFTIADVTQGEWDLNINLPSFGEYLKSVTFGDQDVLFQPMEVKSGSEAALDIVISTRTGKVHGEVDAAGRGDPARAAILLAPVGRFHDLARYYYGILADDDGKFKMMGIAPGKYKIFAIEKLAVEPFRDPDAADQIIALVPDLIQEIEIGEDADVEIHPKLIPEERAREILP